MNRNTLAGYLACDAGLLPDVEFAAATEDSRRAAPRGIFFALRGEHTDGHDHAEEAVRKGAVLVVGEDLGRERCAGVPYVAVDAPRAVLGVVAHALHGDPSKAMTVVGVTGTNGKTSTVTLIHHIFSAHGWKTACFGTLGNRIGDESLPAKHTTAFAEDLADLFARAREAGATHAVMEVSSHALAQDRVAGIDFDVAAFTNLTQDHLDYHASMDDYRAAKLQLFEDLGDHARFTVVNGDDPHAKAFIDASRTACYTYGEAGDCRPSTLVCGPRETTFELDTPWGAAPVSLRLIGRHNAWNAICAMTVCCGLGVDLEEVVRHAGTLASVPGRFEHIDAGQEFQVVVDYAHTEDGLRNVLDAARGLTGKRIIAVFGCGGDRDRSKRPRMAAAVAELADFGIVTSDNPRSEDPERIILDVEQGMQQAGKRKGDDYAVYLDRAEAIDRAIELAAPGDLVLIAGKGHEDYQILGDRRIHFDDREVARACLEKRAGRSSSERKAGRYGLGA